MNSGMIIVYFYLLISKKKKKNITLSAINMLQLKV
jgi:hypothetical protein